MPAKSNQNQPPVYIFTEPQLRDLLGGTIGMFLEYRDHHARDEKQAEPCAVDEMIQGLDGERELVAYHGHIATSQIIPVPMEEIRRDHCSS